MEGLGKTIMVAALGLFVLGGLLYALGAAGFKGLPGDLTFEGRGWKVHFPVATSIVASLLLTLLFSIFMRGGR